jgi:O-antigen/teichoic acid export membrane protein
VGQSPRIESEFVPIGGDADAASHEVGGASRVEQVSSREAGPARRRTWDSLTVSSDIAMLGGGTVLSAVFNIVLVFLIPKIVTISDYGYWRLFLLYASYAGILHLGIADGALLRWAGKPFEEFRCEILPSMKHLFWLNLATIAPLLLLLAFVLPINLRFIAMAVLGFSLVYNLATLLQFGLQAARQFRPVAISTVAPFGLLLIFVVARGPFSAPSFRELVVFYVAAWGLTLCWLFRKARPLPRVGTMSAAPLGKMLVWAGWPVLLANISFALVQRLDRFVVSWTAGIQNFAQYSLAGSALAVPVLAIQAVYKVLFPHLAAVEPERRPQIYHSVSRLLLLAWVLLLPYYFVLAAFVARLLPGYLPSLPVARVLLLGIVFLADLQILHASLSYVHGRQRRFLMLTVGALLLGLALTMFSALVLHSLVALAVSEVITLGVWWISSEYSLRELSGERVADWIGFLAVFAMASVGYWLAGQYARDYITSVLLYYGGAVVLVILAFPREGRQLSRLIAGRRATSGAGW